MTVCMSHIRCPVCGAQMDAVCQEDGSMKHICPLCEEVG